MSYTYEYPRPSVTLDAAVLRTPELKYPDILLIRRGHEPFTDKWALPGGFLEMQEKPLIGAARELAEETGLVELPLKPLFSCGEPNRDPRGRTITMIFACLIRDAERTPIGADDASEAAWFPLDKLPEMAFDHERIVKQIEDHLLWQASTSLIGKDVFHGVASQKEIIRLHRNVCQKSFSDPIKRGEAMGLLSCKDGICDYIAPVPLGPDWQPMVW